MAESSEFSPRRLAFQRGFRPPWRTGGFPSVVWRRLRASGAFRKDYFGSPGSGPGSEYTLNARSSISAEPTEPLG